MRERVPLGPGPEMRAPLSPHSAEGAVIYRFTYVSGGDVGTALFIRETQQQHRHRDAALARANDTRIVPLTLSTLLMDELG